MACCGQGRAALRQAAQQGLSSTPRQAADASQRRVLVRYQATSPVVVRGVGTGQLYTFDAAQPTSYVAETDAAVLLRSRHFVRAD